MDTVRFVLRHLTFHSRSKLPGEVDKSKKDIATGCNTPNRSRCLFPAPYLYLDVLDASNLEAAVVNYHVDWIIHLSAVLSAVGEQNVPLALRINCQGLQNVLEVSK